MMSSLVSTVIAQNQEGKMSDKNLFQLFDSAEEIGVIGSPSSTSELSLDILGQSVEKNLVGELAMCRYMQDGFHNYALGQITEITLRNLWLEGPTIRSIVRETGQLDAISERQDTHQGEMNVSAVFSDENGNYNQSTLGTVPATGNRIRLVDDNFLDELLRPYKDQIFYLGTVYRSKPKLPLWFKHFGEGADGLGEAYHLGIFGKTGSGKSVLTKMILLAYARHRQMGLFILDPMGEFSKGLKDDTSKINSMGEILSPETLTKLDREYQIFDINNFRLSTYELFCTLLDEFKFFRALGIPDASRENRESAIAITKSFLETSDDNLGEFDDQTFNDLLNHLHERADRIYTTPARARVLQDRITEVINRPDDLAKDAWNNTINLFTKENKASIWHVVENALKQQKSRPLVVINLAVKPDDIPESTWDDEIKPLLIDYFLSILTTQAQKAYDEDRSLNTLVVLDEAQRLAPRGRIESVRKNQIRTRLVDAAKTTRKCGLGWMFISLTLSSLDRDIIDSGLRGFFFGFGLGVGTELQALRDLVGRGESSKALELYQRFRDPGSSLNSASREYSFMAIGPVSPLSFGTTPLFLSAFTDPDDFLSANQIIGHQNNTRTIPF